MKVNRRAFAKRLAAFLALFSVGELVRRNWAQIKREGDRLVRQIKENATPAFPTETTQQDSSTKPKKQPSRQLTGDEEKAYAAYLDTFSFRHIKPSEIILPHYRTRNGVNNVLPPEHLWNRLPPTLKVADEIRARLGVKLLRITSAYRSPDYNAQCPGASRGSYHLKNLALDLVYDCPPKVAMAEAKKMRAEGIFKGGLGVYKTFIHIDTRGRNATWG